MSCLYNIFIQLYSFGIRVASLFDRKAKTWMTGRKDIFRRICEALESESHGNDRKIAWFHCASLGEFEQGRPVIEAFRQQKPDYRIFLTFFSPSGYEIRKNYDKADHVFYLPADTPANARKFIELVNPAIVFFIKYEYWFNYMEVLHDRKIPLYVVSAIFRPDHVFFKRYGSWFLERIRQVEWFFLQDQESAKMLMKAGITSFSVTGDTRFDRVEAISRKVQAFPLIEEFCGESDVILAGSTWPEDEEILFPMIYKSDASLKFIIAPHEIHASRISSIISRLKIPALKYSETIGANMQDFRILVVDSMGILAHLYRYAFVAFIGGGFGGGIHNILEAAAFGVPVMFGPNYQKFREAKELIIAGGAFTVSEANQVIQLVNHFLANPESYHKSAATCAKYVQENRGATEKIMEKING
jgi:3-deoxy-D-manno-octulosonic-acid transferase